MALSNDYSLYNLYIIQGFVVFNVVITYVIITFNWNVRNGIERAGRNGMVVRGGMGGMGWDVMGSEGWDGV